MVGVVVFVVDSSVGGRFLVFWVVLFELDLLEVFLLVIGRGGGGRIGGGVFFSFSLRSFFRVVFFGGGFFTFCFIRGFLRKVSVLVFFFLGFSDRCL